MYPIKVNQQRCGIIHDITCDSEGMIDNYVDSEGIEGNFSKHKIKRMSLIY